VRGSVIVWVLCSLAGNALAQGVGVPSSRWGIGFGNSPDFTGLRFNFRDNRVKSVTGINLTLWQPRDDNDDAVVTGLSFGPIPGGGTMRGLQIGLFGVAAMKSAYGVSLATLGMGAGEKLVGLNVAGLGLGAGGSLIGVNLSVLGFGAGKDIIGINIAGLGAGAGERMIGFNFAALGLGAGRELSGINIAGLGLGAGDSLNGVSFGGLAAGAPKVRGLTMAIGVVGGEHLTGVHLAGGAVHVIDHGEMKGLAVSAFNYIKGSQTGVSIGIVNYAYSVRGIQLGVINIVRDNPTPLKVLPIFNTGF